MDQQEPRTAANLETGQTDDQVPLHSEMLSDDEFQPTSQHVSSEDSKSTDQTGDNSGHSPVETVSAWDRNPSETSRHDQPNSSVEAVASDGISVATRNDVETQNIGDKRTEGFDVKRNAIREKTQEPGQFGRNSRSHSASNELTTSSDSDGNQYSHSFESGQESALLLPPPSALRKGRSSIQPLNVSKNQGDNRLPTVKYVKADIKQSREVFETGGERSRPKHLKGVVHSGSDVIEPLPDEFEEGDETPEPQVLIPSTTPDGQPEGSNSWTNSLEVTCLPSCDCFSFLGGMLERQFMRAPLFYSLSSTVTFFALVIFLGSGEDLDILASIIGTVVVCILVTLFVPRGKWAKGGHKQEGVAPGQSEESSLCGSWWRRREPVSVQEKHSQYYRLRDSDTVFEHEVADVSNIDPEDCPQMRLVECQDIMERGSPDSPPERRELNADVHAPGNPRNPESATGKRAKKLKLKTRSKSPVEWAQNGKSEVLKSTLVSLLSETVSIDEDSTSAKFVCEHRGQGVACSCFVDSQR